MINHFEKSDDVVANFLKCDEKLKCYNVTFECLKILKVCRKLDNGDIVNPIKKDQQKPLNKSRDNFKSAFEILKCSYSQSIMNAIKFSKHSYSNGAFHRKRTLNAY